MIPRLLALVLVALLLVGGILINGRLSPFIDLPSLLLTVLPTLGVLVVAHGLGGIGDLIAAATGPQPPARRARARVVARTATGAVWLSGGLGVLMGGVQILGKLDDFPALGPALAVCLLTLFYACALHLLVLLPLERHLAEPPAA